MVTVECRLCFKEMHQYETEKAVPKKVQCPHCGVYQDTGNRPTVSHSVGRNYPQGFWENQ